MPQVERLIPALDHSAQQKPDDVVFTFVDYEVDPAGFAESLTWSQLQQRTQVVADELSRCGSVGDRAAILAPQSLDYIVAFLGALRAGFVAVPLTAPQFGMPDERAAGALRDCTPTAILTTSAIVDDVMPYASANGSGTPAALLEVDALDLDSPNVPTVDIANRPKASYLQYTSGSTRNPAGVIVTDENVVSNAVQGFADYFEHDGPGNTPEGTVFVSWLPFYHDMGLFVGIMGTILGSRRAVLTSPMAFLQRPARWVQMLADHDLAYSAAPNFGFELAVRRTTDEDMAGRDLGRVHSVLSGAERINPATIRRFCDRFGQFNFKDTMIRPSYGLAEATLYVSTPPRETSPNIVRFDYEKLSVGHAQRCDTETGSEQVSCGAPRSCTVRIVDPETRTENPAGKVGEIWIHGPNVAGGYWQNPEATKRTFGGDLVNPSPGTPASPWLRTGDLGVISQDELFIIGRIKDLLIVDGRNHYPDDIESTIQEISGGRAVAISVPQNGTEKLAAIVELKQRGSDQEMADRLQTIRREVTAAISKAHSLRVADLVLVAPGSIPITTSGKVRRSACVEMYRQDQFSRLDSTD